MRAYFLKYLILAILCWTFCWQESHSRVLNKDTESLTSKLGHIQRDIHNVRGHWAQTRKEHNESISVDEQDAILFQYLIVNMIRSVQQSISIVSSVIRICGDTFAGVMSGMVKATGGLLNLASKVFLFLSHKLELAQPHSPAFLGNFSSRCAYGLKKAAPVLHYAGEACIYSGEILESLTLGLGEAVQDSFWGLEVMSNHSNVLVQFLLQIDDSSSVSIGHRVPEMYENSHDVNSGNSGRGNSSTNTTSRGERHIGGAHHKVNLLHPRGGAHPDTHANPEVQPVVHIADPNRPHRSAIEIKLGKEWVAPGTATISVHDTHNSVHGGSDSSKGSGRNSGSAHDTHRDRYIHLNHTFNATSIITKAQRVWSSVVNSTTALVKHYTTTMTSSISNTTDTADTADNDISAGGIQAGGKNETLLTNVIQYVHNTTQYIVCELPTLLDTYTQHTLHISYTILQTMLVLLQQLYTTLMHTQHTESSQGLFFVLALVSTYILSIIPFPNTRVRVLTIIVFSVVVYCSFITTEQIQRTRLVQTTSVQAAHELLVQQANQRSRRVYENNKYGSVYDSVYSMRSDVYSDDYKDIQDVGGLDSGDGMKNDDLTTSPHYEHTSTQDVYSNINHHTTHNVHGTSDLTNTTNTHTSTDANTSSNSSATELFLFDDATYLNTLLTSLWTIHSLHDTTHTTSTAHTTYNYNTGLGAYISDMYLDMINTELSSIPPSVANVKVKQFELGRAPPLFRGVRVYRVRDHVCMRGEVYGTTSSTGSGGSTGSSGSNGGGSSTDSSTSVNSTSTRTDSTANTNTNNNSISAHESFLANLWRSIERHTTGSGNSSGSSGDTSGSGDSGTSGSGGDTSGSGDSGTSGSNSGSEYVGGGRSSDDNTASGDADNTPTTTHTTTTTTTTPAHTTTTNPPNKQLLSQFSAACDHLIMEMDTLYLSDALNVVLTLRKELKSVVPEFSATLTELSLAGQLRLKIKLTPDYPFIGAGQLSFIRAPQLGFSLSSLGGIELSSVPYAFHWVNTSMHYVLEQYTAPYYMELDLRATLCPSCDQPPPVPHDVIKILHSAASSALDRLRDGGARLSILWGKVDAEARRGAATLRALAQQVHRHYLNGVRHVQQTIDDNPHYSNVDAEGALHYSRYKTFDHLEEWDLLHPDEKRMMVNKQKEMGGRDSRSSSGGARGGVVSKVTELWRSGRDEWNHKVRHKRDTSGSDSGSGTCVSSSGGDSGDSTISTTSGVMQTEDGDWMEGVWFT